MSFPPVPAIDLMLNIPGQDNRAWYDFMQPLFLDAASKSYDKMPVEYMFRNVPEGFGDRDPIDGTVELMDRFGVEKAMLGVSTELNRQAIRRFPERFFGSHSVDPNRGMDAVRDIVRLKDELDIKAVTAFPSGLCPQVPIDDRRWYPVYAKCVELDLPICICVGVPGPRLPMAPQKVELLDEVCWFFPELKVVMRHGGEPWEDLAVKLMIKYPNLYAMTSAFAPKYYPRAYIDYANTRGKKKLMYAGYFPMGLSLERIFGELPDVPLSPEVWPRFLRDNAIEVFKL